MLAIEILGEWHQGKRYAHDLLDRVCGQHNLQGADAALLHGMVLAVIRNQTLLDHWIAGLCSHRHLDHRTRAVLRLGIAQLLLLRMPPHAAVNETVTVAGRAKSMVNAVLRRASREGAGLLAQAAALPLSVRTSHPEWLVRRWQAVFGPERTAALCEWNQQPAEIFVRVNRLHPGAAGFAERMADAEGDDLGGFFRCRQLPREELADGVCYAQDPGTALAPRLLDPQPGELVLDACAAPGGKTAMLAEMMQNRGRIIACDVAPSRVDRLRDNLLRMRVGIAEVHRCDWLGSDPAPWGNLRFDRILLDVPCSNTGVMRRRVDVRWRLQEGDFAKLAETQLRMLLRCASLLKPEGTLVYSTCSVDPEENRGVVDRALQDGESLRLLEDEFQFPPEAGYDGAYAARLSNKPAKPPSNPNQDAEPAS